MSSEFKKKKMLMNQKENTMMLNILSMSPSPSDVGKQSSRPIISGTYSQGCYAKKGI